MCDFMRLTDYQHEKDRGLAAKILDNAAVKKALEIAAEYKLEDIYTYVYKSSCLRLTQENAPGIIALLRRAEKMLGMTQPVEIYMQHNYDEDIRICGFHSPFLLISAHYLKALDEKMLLGILVSRLAGICAGHHRVLFLLEILELAIGYMSIPILADLAIGGISNDWKRCRYYTYDRAFYLATGSREMTLRQLFVPVLDNEQIDRFCFECEQDGYEEQVHMFEKKEGLDDALEAANSILSNQAWTPQRYREIRAFAGW